MKEKWHVLIISNMVLLLKQNINIHSSWVKIVNRSLYIIYIKMINDSWMKY